MGDDEGMWTGVTLPKADLKALLRAEVRKMIKNTSRRHVAWKSFETNIRGRVKRTMTGKLRGD